MKSAMQALAFLLTIFLFSQSDAAPAAEAPDCKKLAHELCLKARVPPHECEAKLPSECAGKLPMPRDHKHHDQFRKIEAACGEALMKECHAQASHEARRQCLMDKGTDACKAAVQIMPAPPPED